MSLEDKKARWNKKMKKVCEMVVWRLAFREEKVVVCLIRTSGSDDDERPKDEHGSHHGDHAAGK